MAKKFILKSPFEPAGDQPKAITTLSEGIESGIPKQTLLGVTGSGKTYVMASVIAKTQRPALVISHNKTLAAQLAEELKEFFPENSVQYFVSYYDYYQPEAYIPRTDTYIAKDSSINDEIDRLRHAAMEAILTRPDTIVVASVSCIYGLGAPSVYTDWRIGLTKGAVMSRQQLLLELTRLQYNRDDLDPSRGDFRVRGDVVDIFPAGEDHLVRVEFFGAVIDSVTILDSLTGHKIKNATPDEPISIFPATFFIASLEQRNRAMDSIRIELAEQIQHFKKIGKEVEAQRIAQRATYDLEMLEHLGYVSGIENYSRHLDGRAPGEPPSTLIDYFTHSFGKNFLTFIDESHMTIPQVSAMYGGDSARKKSLIEHGFRLPSAADNRPLKFHEFEDRISQTVFVSATPAKYEQNTSKKTVELIVRPTGLLDPLIEIKPTDHQVDDVMDQIKERIASKQRVLVTTLTKRMAEELATYLVETGTKAAYLHSDIDTFERLDILRSLRSGTYDVLVGINLLREGLDLPEVSLVAIMDADKEGYLRSQTALIQTMGRAARHSEGKVIMYANTITGSMKAAIDETQRRRSIQEKYNTEHGVTPTTISKAIRYGIMGAEKEKEAEDIDIDEIPPEEIERAVKTLKNKMQIAAQNLEFEKAAKLRDNIQKLRKRRVKNGK
ncbi:MAG: excinuclease ABC subunit UvrB [Candidatus Andersenbacteria bacterium]|nr:excinuclease ABC subunit UvrB [Candidatus Andersenbacteria bacterium]MBI3251169.1 excinuclease ABC subunit UvrB [Candidatus Andersenbacteria bacterium]